MTIQKQIILFLLLTLVPTGASAATITLHASPESVGAGDVVRVSALLDSTIATNAFSGTLRYSGATLEPVAISDGNSIISVWITHPVMPVAGAPITYAGITPGGFSGNGGALFSVLFRAKAAGAANVSLANVEVLRNDGAGTNEPVTAPPLVFSVGEAPNGGYKEPVDTTPPEPFTAQLGSDPQLFGGRSYLVFTAVDKGSGVDHYTLAETRIPALLRSLIPRSWYRATTSPYMLADQNLTSTVYIEAVDRSGNARQSMFSPQHLFTTYEKVILLAILLLCVFLYWFGWGRHLINKP